MCSHCLLPHHAQLWLTFLHVLPWQRFFPCLDFEKLHKYNKFRSGGKEEPLSYCPKTQTSRLHPWNPPPIQPLTHTPSLHREHSCFWKCSRVPVHHLLSSLMLHSHTVPPTAPLPSAEVPLPKITSEDEATPRKKHQIFPTAQPNVNIVHMLQCTAGNLSVMHQGPSPTMLGHCNAVQY